MNVSLSLGWTRPMHARLLCIWASEQEYMRRLMLSWVIPSAKCRQLIKNIKTRPSASCSESHVDMYSVFWFFPKQDLYYVNHYYKQLCSIAQRGCNLKPKFAIIFVKIKYWKWIKWCTAVWRWSCFNEDLPIKSERITYEVGACWL